MCGRKERNMEKGHNKKDAVARQDQNVLHL